jgi:proliferating cell nuclear antigen PCNA
MSGFKLKFKDTKFVRGIFEAISATLTETRMKISPEGLNVTGMDGSHICLCDVNLKKVDFLFFETNSTYELGLNLDDLVKIIKRGGATDELTFLHDPKEKKLVIEMKKENSKKARTFTMSLIDLDQEEIDLKQLAEMPFENTTTFNVSILDEAIKDAEIFAEVLNIKVKEPLLTLWAEGTMGDMKYEIEKEELILSDFKEVSEGAFAIQFLKNILKITSICDQVSIRLKSESPMHLKFMIGGFVEGSMPESYVQYYLAPRVEEDIDGQYQED